MANTTDKSILTAAGKALLAQLNAEEKPLIIDKMIFANVPNRPEFPQPDDVVPTDDIVHQEQVEQRGRLSADSVIYSTTLTSDVGPFEFNWTGAYCSEYGVLVTIDHHALTPKTADEPGVAGNTLVRSVVLEYKDIAEITNITVDASSWQYNATDRMKKMDSDVAQSIIDQNGKDWFIEDGFLVTPSGNAYNIKAGAGYVSGNRVSMEFDRSVQVPNKPSFIYIDAHREGTPTGEQVTLFDFVITAEEKDDYIDSSTGKDIPHFVCKIAEVLADGSVSDLRPEADSASREWVNKGVTDSILPFNEYRPVSSKLKDVLNVRDFGAVGDGVTDDTQALIAAFTSAVNGVLEFEKGKEYLVTDYLGMFSGMFMKVIGNGATLKMRGLTPEQYTEEGDAARGWWWLTRCLTIKNTVGTTIENLNFDGMNTFLYGMLAVTGRADVRGCSFKNIRYPSPTFSPQWATSNEGAFATSSGVGSCLDSLWFEENYFYYFDGSEVTPNSNGDYQARSLMLNGSGSNNNSTYTNIKFKYVSMGVVIDGGSDLVFDSCHFERVKANSVYELGGTNIRYVNNSFVDCYDQGISTYGTNIIISNNTFYNVRNRPVAIRGSSKNRLSITGNTFRHQAREVFESMMPIGRPDSSSPNHLMSHVVISGNTFMLEKMNYYIAELGPVEDSLIITGNTVWVGNVLYPGSSSNCFFSFYNPNAEDKLKPIINNNAIEYLGSNRVMLCPEGHEAVVFPSSFTGVMPIIPEDADTTIYSPGLRDRTIEGQQTSAEPKGCMHVKATRGIFNGEEKLSQSVLQTFSADASIYSTESFHTIGAVGFKFVNETNNDPDSKYMFLLPDTASKTLVEKAFIDSKGRYNNKTPGEGLVLRSVGGIDWSLSVADDGTVVVTAV
ncbi:phage tail-collar fiber domain-containing protein [Vibrio alginolyticus]|uniref:phage tail-collar fiber domain-containing protein n=1 Tax=Vibrio alginolyticus TaxID=663 RepID=UPI003753FD1A